MLEKPVRPRSVNEIIRGTKAFRNFHWNRRKENEIGESYAYDCTSYAKSYD